MLDRNIGRRFCIGEHCRAIFMVEIKFGDEWGATPKQFYSKEEAETEAIPISTRVSFCLGMSGYRKKNRREFFELATSSHFKN